MLAGRGQFITAQPFLGEIDCTTRLEKLHITPLKAAQTDALASEAPKAKLITDLQIDLKIASFKPP